MDSLAKMEMIVRPGTSPSEEILIEEASRTVLIVLDLSGI